MKISYDRILTSNAENYCMNHPEVDINGAIDIIRGKADQDYLDAITLHCHPDKKECENDQSYIVKQIIYLDRNNTPDVWPDI